VVWSIHSSSRGWFFIPRKVTVPGPWKVTYSIHEELLRVRVDLRVAIRAVADGFLDGEWKLGGDPSAVF
jgi:hypothetical protein